MRNWIHAEVWYRSFWCAMWYLYGCSGDGVREGVRRSVRTVVSGTWQVQKGRKMMLKVWWRET